MNEFFVGAAGFMAFKALDKAVLEPIATNIGRKLVARYLGPACNHLDIALATFGVDCDPEAIVRDYLDQEPEELSPEQVKVCHDIRRRRQNEVAARNCRKRKMDTIDELQRQLEQV